MTFTNKIALIGALTAAVAAPTAALAKGGPAVSVRIEGTTKTLLVGKTVHLKAGWLTRDGAKKGQCPARSAAGALDTATQHRWGGTFYSTTSFTDYLITSILGERYTSKSASYWEFFINGVSASEGVCQYAPHSGDQILFAAMPVADSHDDTLVLLGAPRHARAGHSFTVKVDYVSAAGKRIPISGARVSGAGSAVVTGSKGTATITPTRSGTLQLTASHAVTTDRKGHKFGYVRSARVSVRVS